MNNSICSRCHKPITDPRSIARGMGPQCYINHGCQNDLFGSNAPVYDFSVKEVDGKKVLCIVDLYTDTSPTVTVTNGAELVLNEIAKKLGKLPEVIIYQDTEGEWDRIRASANGDFKGFSPLAKGLGRRITSESEALRIVSRH
ncbi:DUF6011 domain-containing protein [Microbulbifer epialgicus]|uniref:DUF6011 domain-containing protein n=1 Tax=Microbulbifer epialgicus TaxID=393907 RepID=A0ABV4NY16_9GAMM